LAESGASKVRRVSDTVFAATETVNFKLQAGIDSSKPLVLVNASGYVARKFRQTSAYVDLVTYLVNEDFQVVLLPHVIRSSGDDLSACRAIHLGLSDEVRAGVQVVDELLRPGQIRALAKNAHFVVTGRMHLSVIALSQGVPAAVVATQGKVDGLLRDCGTPELVVDPTKFDDGVLRDRAILLVQDHQRFTEVVGRRRAEMARLSGLNFSGLDT